MTKRVAFGPTPTANHPKPAPDQQAKIAQFVEQGSKEEGTKRFTIDVPASLHKRVKATCAMRDQKMNDVLTKLIAEAFPEEG